MVYITINSNSQGLIQDSNISDELFLKILNGSQQKAPSQTLEEVVNMPLTQKLKIL